MTAWPQFERCAVAQWRGYDPRTREVMSAEWKQRHGAPGTIGNTGHSLHVIWRVEHLDLSNTCQDLLMTIKEDLGPDLTDTKNLIVVGEAPIDNHGPLSIG